MIRELTLQECIDIYGGCCVDGAYTEYGSVFMTPLIIRSKLFDV